ncbi:MAG TPA: hypothetical protein VIJ76_01670 [Galbitalea sp.]
MSSNWSRQAGGILLQIAEALEAASPEDWELQTQRPNATVRDVAHSLVRVAASSRATRGETLDDTRSAARIREAAIDKLTGKPRTRARTLGAILVAGYDLTRALGTPLSVDATVTGAVAVARSLTAPLEIRVVVRARTLMATDDGWRVGFEPELHGSAEAIVLFLYGRGILPRDVAEKR